VLEHLAHPERDWHDTFNLLALIDWVRVDAPAILVFYVLATALVWAWRSRSRVVVSEFEDFTGDQSKSVTRGLSTLLVVQLGRLGDLYAAVDYQRAVSTSAGRSRPIDATIRVDDVDESLKGAVGGESPFRLGPLAVRVGSLMALIGRLVQGPRILGSLHTADGRFVLTAQLVGGPRSYRWRIDDAAGKRGP